MNLSFIHNNNSTRLILIFNGWGVGIDIFNQVNKPGYDVAVVYNYSNSELDIAPLRSYSEICIIAWSMGVWHADKFIRSHENLPITRCVAINGTLAPIHLSLGIPPKVFQLTAALPDEQAHAKFLRRAGAPIYPGADIAALRDELTIIGNRCATDDNLKASDIDTSLWDEIIISDNDRIFPLDNMLQAWHSAKERITMLHGSSHTPNFASLIPQIPVDKVLVGQRFASTINQYNNEAHIQTIVANNVASLIKLIYEREIIRSDVLEIGVGGGLLTQRYIPMLSGCHIKLWDLVVPSFPSRVGDNTITTLSCDAETTIHGLNDYSLDLIISSSTIQWFNSPRRFLLTCAQKLRRGGRAIISCYVKGSIPQLNDIPNAKPLRYPVLNDLGVLLGRNFSVSTMTRTHTQQFDSPTDVLRHLRATGVNSLDRTPLPIKSTRQLLNAFAADECKLSFVTTYISIYRYD